MTQSENQKLDELLVVNPSMSIIRGSDDEIMSRYGSRSRSSYRVAAPGGVLANFVRAFTEPSRPSEVAERLGIDTETCAQYTEKLTEGAILMAPEHTRYAQLVSAMHVQPPTGRDTAISVLGSGRIAAASAAQLTDLMGSDVAVTEDLTVAFEDHDLVVVCADRLNQPLFYDADEMARAADRPWHLTYADGAEIIIGPTFIPGITVNYFDRDTLDEASRSLRFEHQFMASAGPDIEATSPIPEFVAQLAAGWSTAAIAQHLWGTGSFVEDHVLRVDLERMQVIRDRVLALARNPVTVGSRTDLRHPFI